MANRTDESQNDPSTHGTRTPHNQALTFPLRQPVDTVALLVEVFGQKFGLSRRETMVCRLLASGLTEKEMNPRLGLGAKTSASYLRRASEKVGVGNRNDLRAAIVKFAADGWCQDRH